jgi:hypothetical protein
MPTVILSLSLFEDLQFFCADHIISFMLTCFVCKASPESAQTYALIYSI